MKAILVIFFALISCIVIFAGCGDSGIECVPNDHTICNAGGTFWADSCDNPGDLIEECECGCDSDASACEDDCGCQGPADCAPLGSNYFCNLATGECECTPQCTDRCCGDDGCGGTCPDACDTEQTCNPATCLCEDTCVADCSGRQCGDDGCGGSCAPGCSGEDVCNSDGLCETPCVADCAGRQCGDDGCGGSCAPGCSGEDVCNSDGLCETPCVADCAGRQCGDDGCGGSCAPGCSGEDVCDPAGQCVEYWCGDGVRTGSETCEGSDLGDYDCSMLGLGPGTLLCTAQCSFDTSGCSAAPVCGNGEVEDGEACDDGEKDTCTGYCNADCSGQADYCGDGIVSCGEACDDGNRQSGDGCTGLCDAVERYFTCPQPGQPCQIQIVCGDGRIEADETCDDGNSNPGDGCDAACQLELGALCPVAGVACVPAACGDGIVFWPEQCEDDDPIPQDGDGCSADCRLEEGFFCPTAGAACTPTVCGDSNPEGFEECDDGNASFGDGCTPACTIEPDCSAACVSRCGDGLRLPNGNEECDDGNTRPGDGCSPTCQVEPGFDCSAAGVAPTEVRLPMVVRDFSSSHPDFESFVGNDPGIVEVILGADGKPVYANAGGSTLTTTGETEFDQWYNDENGINQTFIQALVLGLISGGSYQFSSNSFFPVDGLGYGNEGQAHNYWFTTEVRLWFVYNPPEQIDFLGDDDFFLFVNGILAIDLGGVHGAQAGSVTLDASTAGQFGLTPGEIYPVAIFQAERHTTQSNYRLTLSGFDFSGDVCVSDCGDGIHAADEACDDGVNDGSYGSCTPLCELGPHCGDSTLQSPPEGCDDGQNVDLYGGCTPACTPGGTCGDGVVDSLFGEECDDGDTVGQGYGTCTADCHLGPRCGDGNPDPGEEECDDGNRDNDDGCDNTCHGS